MKVGDTIYHKNNPNRLFEIIEVSNRKQGITEIVFHPLGNPRKIQASWARWYKVNEPERLTEYQTALLLASEAAIEAEGVTKEALEFLYRSCIVESTDAHAIAADDLFTAIEQL